MEGPVDKSFLKGTVPCVFTFVPVVEKLTIKNSLETSSAASQKKQRENVVEVETTMSREQPFTNSERSGGRTSVQSYRNIARAPPHDPVFGLAPSFRDPSENISHGEQAPMEAAANKHTEISEQRYQCVPGRAPEVSLGCYFTTQHDRSSPTSSADLFPTPASSRESILSACSEKDASSISSSRTISPCSSIYSGIFTPSIVTVKKHVLAPGSSLMSLPQSLRSSCESISCPMSPTTSRHRPPLTRLSLLTAILRKGRLPVLSSTVQRPYTPCWPVNNITLGNCSACSAASSVASIPFELSSDFSSTTSIDSQSDAYRDPSRCATAPPLLCKTTPHQNQIKTNIVQRWQKVISPPPLSALKKQKKYSSLRPAPQSVSSSIVKSISPINQSYVSVAKPLPPTVKPSICVNVQDSPNKVTCLSPEPAFEPDPGVSQTWARLPHYSFSKLQSHSHPGKSSPNSFSQDVTSAYSPSPSPTHLTAGKPLVPSQSEPKMSPHLSHLLSPSRHTPTALSGRPLLGASSFPRPSPAPPIRDLTSSPSLSLRSTPSPRPGSGLSDGPDREVKRKPHKIKSRYKSLAAIPTNTLLLDQQVIDEQVDSSQDSTGDRGVSLDAHDADTDKEMCCPAWLRKESEELYAVIDEILGNTSIPPKSKSPINNETQKNKMTFPHSYGRETKYASVGHLNPPGYNQRRADSDETRPGVIRSVSPVTRLTAEPHLKSECGPFRRFESQQFSDSTKSEGSRAADGGSGACDLHITEPDEPLGLPKYRTSLSSSSFCPTERKLMAFQTQI
ncbi:unnamed protein product [Knipowitschia caucasica]